MPATRLARDTMAKKKTKAQREEDIAFRHEFDRCWACSRRHKEYPQFEQLQNAHIIGGDGRRHDRRDLTRLCERCHGLNHHLTYREGEIVLPHLELSAMLTLKQEFDPEYYDLEYLASLGIRSLPDPGPLPEWYLLEREKNGPP